MAVLERERRFFPALNLGGLPRVLLFAVVAFLVLYPLGMLLYGSVSTALPGQAGSITLSNYEQVFTTGSTYRVFLVTLLLVVPRVFLALALATAFAWILARTNTPFRNVLEMLMIFMFFLPSLPWLISWTLMATPRVGFLNQFVFAHLPGNLEPNVFSYAGIIFLGAVRAAPIMYLFISPAFKAMDASLEESSRMSGANALTTIRRINIPLAAPALTAMAIMSIIVNLESFELEFVLGRPAGVWVLSTQIWRLIYDTFPPQWGMATAMSMILMVITFGLVVLQWRILGSRIFAVVTGRGYQARPYNLGRWRWFTFGFILAYFVVFILVPFAILVINSFTFVAGMYGWGYFTLDQWRFGLSAAALPKTVMNTLVMGALGATIGIVLCASISYLVTRTHWRARRALDLVSWIPFTVPGIVMGIGYLWAYIFLPVPLYGTLWVLVIVFVARTLPFGCRILSSTMVQVGPELEESSRIHGASWLYTFRRVMFPLLTPAFIASWILLFAFAVRNVETVLFLYGPGSRVMSVDIFSAIQSGRPEQALVMSLLQTALLVAAFAVSRALAPRSKLA